MTVKQSRGEVHYIYAMDIVRRGSEAFDVLATQVTSDVVTTSRAGFDLSFRSGRLVPPCARAIENIYIADREGINNIGEYVTPV